jgi:hypothetical protein
VLPAIALFKADSLSLMKQLILFSFSNKNKSANYIASMALLNMVSPIVELELVEFRVS